MSAGAITLLVDDPGWRRRRGLDARLRRAAGAALRAAGLSGRLTLLLSSDEKLQTLNREFRGRDKPTNVLSFPATENQESYRGDIAIAYGVTRREAQAAGKRFADHASHLVVHGVLHLAGYDHEKPRDAKIMEPLEVKILKRLGIQNPYTETSGSAGQEKCAPDAMAQQGRARGFPSGRATQKT
jgi:probable rRNA maturation factor